jgi:phosphoribosylanthranilate isomerase
VSVQVKICGVTNLDDAEGAVELGAWAVGLIFHEPSPRRCAIDDAAEIAAAVKRRAEVVGVFVNRPIDEVVRIADQAGLSALQLHGDEGPAFCEEAGHRTGCRVIKAAQVRDRGDLHDLQRYRVDFHLLDAHGRGLRGGTGETFDWEIARARQGDVPLILSGGLTAENVAAGIAAVRPWAVDVASGVEAEPGRKDPAKLAAFFDAVRSAAPAAVA